MKKFQLSIPKPCHENWDAMIPEDKGRFCGSCQKTVIDFSDMSDRQVAEFFKKPADAVCGRFHQDQLQRTMEIPRKRLPWIKHFFTIALPAFLLTLKAGAQRETRLVGKVVCEKPVKGDTLVLPAQTSNTSKVFLGKVVDENGLPLPGASVFIRNTNKGTATNQLGEFRILLNQNETELTFSYVGFETRTIHVAGRDSVFVTLNYAMQGEVVVTMGIVARKEPKSVPLMPSKSIDTAFSKFSVFPNPVSSNSSFTIKAKDLEDGRYVLSIVTSGGELVQTKDVVINKKTGPLSVKLENIAAAPYFIRLTNDTNNKTYTEILLVK